MSPRIWCPVVGLLILLSSVEVKAKVPGKLRGKIYFTTSRIKDTAEAELVRMFKSSKPRVTLKRDKDSHWKVTIVAFFRKAAVDGPVTLWFFDKSDKSAIRNREATHVESVNGKGKKIFVFDLDINPDNGFNKKYSYLIHIGQLIGKRSQIYAKGSVSLEP